MPDYPTRRRELRALATAYALKIWPTLDGGCTYQLLAIEPAANYHAMQAEPQDRITPEYRRASSALDYILKVLTGPELTAYYQAVGSRREKRS